MSFQFNADEIFEMAVQIERNGARFYRKAAQMVEGERTAQLLLDLAGWEDGHEQAFATLRQGLTEAQRRPTTFDPDQETSLYLRAMADGHVFDVKVDPADLLTGKETKAEILRLALGQEKDSIVFYLGLKEMMTETGGKEKIDKIIAEEMRHIGFLNREVGRLQNEST